MALFCLGTDGFGRSDTRQNLRKFFEIDKDHIVYSSLIALNKLDEAISYLKKIILLLMRNIHGRNERSRIKDPKSWRSRRY